MKSLTILMLAMLMVSFMAPMILAEETVTDDSSDAISLYDDTSNLPEGTVISPAPTTDDTIATEASQDMSEESASALKVGLKKMSVWFTLKQEAKAEKELEIAKLYLIRAKIAAKNGNENAVTKALEAHNKIVERAQNRMNAIDGESTEEKVKETAGKVVALQRSIAVHEARIAKLQEMLGSSELTDEQKARIEAKILKAQTVTDKLRGLSEAKKDKLQTRLMAVAGMSEEEADAAIEAKGEALKEKIRERIKEIESEDTEAEDTEDSEVEVEDTEESEVEDTEDSEVEDTDEGVQVQAGQDNEANSA